MDSNMEHIFSNAALYRLYIRNSPLLWTKRLLYSRFFRDRLA